MRPVPAALHNPTRRTALDGPRGWAHRALDDVFAEAASTADVFTRDLRVVVADPRRATNVLGAFVLGAPLPDVKVSLERQGPQAVMVGQMARQSATQTAVFGPPKRAPGVRDVSDPAPTEFVQLLPGDWNRKEWLRAPLFVSGVHHRDVFQGNLGDCYLASAASALASARPEMAVKLLTPNRDGTTTVHLRRFSGETGLYEPVDVVVDADFYLTSDGNMRYGRTRENSAAHVADSELWWPLVEKAYAEMKGKSYEAIGRGGNPALTLSELTGAWSDTHRLTTPAKGEAKAKNDRALMNTLLDATAKRLPVVAWTFDDEGKYAASKVENNHAYAVLRSERNAAGDVFVVLRNPRGMGEPVGNGADDGEFTLPFSEFQLLFSDYAVSRIDQL